MNELISAPITENEAARIAAIERYKLIGLGREPEFDRITDLAATLFDVPIALVSIVGSEDQCFRGACGIDVWGTPRDIAFCAFAILSEEVMVVEDALLDTRFIDNPLVTDDPHIRFYAGAPLRIDGQPIGSLCLIDTKPRSFGANERAKLAKLARSVIDMIALRVGSVVAEEHRAMLSEQRELLQLTVENVSEGIALVDGELSMILWNEAFCDLFGYTQDLVQKTDNAAVLMRITAGRGELGPGDPDMILQAFIASIKSTESRRIEIQRTDGRILDIWRKTISGGRFIMTARDVTEERQIQHLKDELVTTVSHELRTPLTAISGSLGLMDAGVAGPLPEKAAQLVRIAHKNSERLARLVNDLLDMDKLRSGSAVFNFAPVDLRGLLTDSVEQNGPYADRFGVRVALEMPDLLLVAMADADRMGQVLANLLSNAAKFSPPGSVVTVRLAMQDGQARISVIDRGPGISAEFRKRIFSRFAQEAGSSHRGQAGTGLGLAISKNIVEHHGGTIMLDPDTSGGAAFHIQLPVVGVEKEPR